VTNPDYRARRHRPLRLDVVVDGELGDRGLGTVGRIRAGDLLDGREELLFPKTWHGDGKIYFVATSGGPQRGQVFEYDPKTDRLRLIFSSPGNDVLDSPDNITFSPRGGMVLCEDGSGRDGLTLDGQIFRFAENNIVLNGERGFMGDFSGSEWAGATFEPKNGNWLFVNIQSPGITFAITGRWKQGPL
jgi:secreted PhoX family phosphatase